MKYEFTYVLNLKEMNVVSSGWKKEQGIPSGPVLRNDVLGCLLASIYLHTHVFMWTYSQVDGDKSSHIGRLFFKRKKEKNWEQGVSII